LIGAVVGGVIGAWANSWWREREANKARERELKGIAYLLSAEHAYNASRMGVFSKDADFLTLSSFTDLQMGAWESSRARVAQLLPTLKVAEHEQEVGFLTALTWYYTEIQSIQAIIEDDELTNDQKKELMSGHVEAAEKYGKAAMLFAGEYLFKGHPDDAAEYQNLFSREAKRLLSGEEQPNEEEQSEP